MQKRVIVLGGTGFIGRHVVSALLAAGCEVTVVSRHGKTSNANTDFTVLQLDLYLTNSEELTQLFKGFDGLVYAAGVDERVAIKGDAYAFFAKKNIQPMQQVLEAAKLAGIKRAVLMNSIFSFLQRSRPELQLEKKHAYIISRVDQRDIALQYADADFSVYVFEVPYVFGDDAERCNQWQHLIDYIRLMEPLFITDGGANMLAVQTLANAVVAALCTEKTAPSGCYVIGGENMTWQSLLQRLSGLMQQQKRLVMVRTGVMDKLSRLGGLFKQMLAIRSGLDDRYMAELVTQEMFFDVAETLAHFSYEQYDLDKAFAQTIAACTEKTKMKALWQMAGIVRS